MSSAAPICRVSRSSEEPEKRYILHKKNINVLSINVLSEYLWLISRLPPKSFCAKSRLPPKSFVYILVLVGCAEKPLSMLIYSQ